MILFTGLFVVILIMCSISIADISTDGRARGESGGTDANIGISAEAGGSFFQWNQVHGMVINEDGVKIDDPFNVTVCVSIVEVNGTYESQGHIFGELNRIRWDDDPEPSITVSSPEYFTYAGENDHSLTVYVLGNYQREIQNETENRQAYNTIVIYRPNEAPEAIASIAGFPIEGEENWTEWKNTDNKTHFNDMGEFVYYIDETDDLLRLHCNASNSRDPENDDIIRWSWDLYDDGSFGELAFERKMNTTVALGRGDHVIGLKVFDGRNWSEVLEIPILIRTCQKIPDLTVIDLQLENHNGEDIFQQGDFVKIRATLRNIGEAPTFSPFQAVLYYWYRDAEPDQLTVTTVMIEDTVPVNGLELIEITWKTWLPEYQQGMYDINVIIDTMGNVTEMREQNNQRTVENITLEYGPPPPSHLEFHEILLSSTSAFINEYIYINITIRNIGDVQARYIDVHLYINDEYQHFKSIDAIDPGATGNLSFQMTGDTGAIYEVYFIVKDDGIVIDISDDHYVEFIKYSYEEPVIPRPPPPPPPDDDTFSLDLRLIMVLFFIAFLTLIPFMILFKQWKKGGIDAARMRSQNEKSILPRKDSKNPEPDEFEKE